MQESRVIGVNPEELANIISQQVREDLQKYATNPKLSEISKTDKPHLTRQETADFFDVSVGCINDWSNKGILKPIKVGQRTYFKKSDLMELMFEKENK